MVSDCGFMKGVGYRAAFRGPHIRGEFRIATGMTGAGGEQPMLAFRAEFWPRKLASSPCTATSLLSVPTLTAVLKRSKKHTQS